MSRSSWMAYGKALWSKMKNAEHASVLVVEDSDTIRKVIVRIVKQIGVSDVREAADGGEAWKLIQENRPDIILSDWHMAPVDGFKLLRRVKGEESTEHIPFFMITTESNVSLVSKAKQAGADVFIHKPFTSELLREKLRRFIIFDAPNKGVVYG